MNTGDFSAGAITRFAQQQGIGAGIVVGRLQHEKRIAYSMQNGLKERPSWEDE